MLQIEYQLQPKQLDLAPKYLDHWRNLARATRPLNIEHTEAMLGLLYERLKLPQPKIHFFLGPLAALENFDLSFFGQPTVNVGKAIETDLKQQLGLSTWGTLRQTLYTPLHDQLWQQTGWWIYRDLYEYGYALWHDLNAGYSSHRPYCNPLQQAQPTEYLVATACWFDFCYSVLKCEDRCQLWPLYQWLVMQCGWLWLYESGCLVSQRPVDLQFDEQDRLQGVGTPAIQFADGLSIYSFEGIRLPHKYGSLFPSQWQPRWILQEDNAELRRILIQQIGYERIYQELGAEEIDVWEDYTLVRLQPFEDNRTPIQLVVMTCPSTGHTHVLRVPPTMTSARDAIRWINWDLDPTAFKVQT